jgi:signal peptidase II
MSSESIPNGHPEDRPDFTKVAVVLIVILLAVTVADQYTKVLVRASQLDEDPMQVIPGFFTLVHWSNEGIAFGKFQDHGRLLTVLGVLALIGIPVFFWYEWRRQPALGRLALPLGLILGGALGNVIDRFRFGEVTDFLLFYIGKYQWPAFNVADSCICVGTGLVILMAWRQKEDEVADNKDAASGAESSTEEPEEPVGM